MIMLAAVMMMIIRFGVVVLLTCPQDYEDWLLFSYID